MLILHPGHHETIADLDHLQHMYTARAPECLVNYPPDEPLPPSQANIGQAFGLRNLGDQSTGSLVGNALAPARWHNGTIALGCPGPAKKKGGSNTLEPASSHRPTHPIGYTTHTTYSSLSVRWNKNEAWQGMQDSARYEKKQVFAQSARHTTAIVTHRPVGASTSQA